MHRSHALVNFVGLQRTAKAYMLASILARSSFDILSQM